MTVKATRHGKKRVKERTGINPSSADRQAELAKERGLYHKDMSGNLFKWVSSYSHQFGKYRGATYVAYNNKLFIFTNDCTLLITVIAMPSNLTKIAASQIARQQSER